MYRKNLVFAAACLGMLLFGVVFLSLGSVNNMLAARFKLDDSAIGTLTALLPFGILVGSLVFGPIVDRFGYRWMLIAASLIVGVALEGMAYAVSKRLVQLFVFAIGFGGGILNGATNALAADVSEGERGAKLSLLGVFFGIGALTMPSAIAILSRTFSLSTIVSAIGTLVLIPAAYCLAIAFPPPKQRAEKLSLASGFALLREPSFLFACLALAVQSGMEGMSNDWTTRYFKNAVLAGQSFTERDAQLALVALTGAMVVTRFALSSLLTRVNSRTVLLVSVGTTTCGAVLLTSTNNYHAALLGPLLIGMGLAAIFPVVLGFVGDRYPQQSGAAFSTVFVLALTGNMAINKTFGHVAHGYGVRQYPIMLLCLLVFSALLLLMVIKQFATRNPENQK
ncbi:MAG TPA: MFS transporter [Lacipirellulaceae bacterium]|nr:MFS transporter [Lacipirellulaceae bacterium]